MKRQVLALTTLLLFALVVRADDKFTVPDQKINGGGTVSAGDVVVLSVSPIDNDKKPENLQNVVYNWKILEDGKIKTKGVQEWPGNDRVVFGAGIKKGKKFTGILSITYLYVVKDKDGKITEVATRSKLLMDEVVVEGDVPGPDPGPGPGPNPNPNPPAPVLPDGKYKLAKFSYDNSLQKVDASIRKADSLALATSFNGIASKIASGSFTSLEDILKETQTSNRTALKDNTNKWENFFIELQKNLYTLYKGKQMATMEDFATAWKEIATGLEAGGK